MATNTIKQLPCDLDEVCMVCKDIPYKYETVFCDTCVTQWHKTCLISPPETASEALVWVCPNCTYVDITEATTNAPIGETSNKLDTAIVDRKGKGKMAAEMVVVEEDEDDERTETDRDINDIDVDDEDEYEDGYVRCSLCLRPLERPMTAFCGHNFCLTCFENWMSQGKPNCPKCYSITLSIMARKSRVKSNTEKAIVVANVPISEQPQGTGCSQTDRPRPNAAFTTERAKKPGLANASSGRILVTVPGDHFGPITAENDPERNLGVLVGEIWMSRMEVRQWGVHIPHISGISGQSKHGAQSVVLSGGYPDDKDHGDWFLYTGSGGRDLTGNRRTNKKQSSDQHFTKKNESLRLSCQKGYPIRVVRAYKNKRSEYSPREGYRYDGIYRIESCWRIVGVQGFLICRYLFIRCDNNPAPWNTSIERGDLPRPEPYVSELDDAIDVYQREETPHWDFDEIKRCWLWKKPPPPSKEINGNGDSNRKRRRKNKESFELAEPIRQLEGGREDNTQLVEFSNGWEEEMDIFGENDDQGS